MPTFRISDPHDARLEPYRLVQDRDRAGAAARAGLFIGETPVVVSAMLEEPGRTQSILVAENQEARVHDMLAAAAARWPAGAAHPDVFVVPVPVVEGVTGFHVHRGLLAVGVRPALRGVAQVVPAAGLSATLLCVEGVNNMDNIGQLFRVAAAFACDGVLLSPDCHDPHYRKSLRVSCGCALRVPFARSTDWAADVQALGGAHGMTLVGATGGGAATLDEVARAAPSRVAVMVGAEFAGLAPATLAACHHRVRVPMAPGVDSLNVAVAAAVFLDRLSRGPRQ